jgi:hypothetical protein
MRLSIIAVAMLVLCTSALRGAEIPKLEKRDWIDPKVAAALTNKTEILLHAIRLPEVQFAQACLVDIVDFLNHSIEERATTAESKSIRIQLGSNVTFGEGDRYIITLGARDISVLEVLEYLRRVAELDRQFEGRNVTLVRKTEQSNNGCPYRDKLADLGR